MIKRKKNMQAVLESNPGIQVRTCISLVKYENSGASGALFLREHLESHQNHHQNGQQRQPLNFITFSQANVSVAGF